MRGSHLTHIQTLIGLRQKNTPIIMDNYNVSELFTGGFQPGLLGGFYSLQFSVSNGSEISLKMSLKLVNVVIVKIEMKSMLQFSRKARKRDKFWPVSRVNFSHSNPITVSQRRVQRFRLFS